MTKTYIIQLWTNERLMKTWSAINLKHTDTEKLKSNVFNKTTIHQLSVYFVFWIKIKNYCGEY